MTQNEFNVVLEQQYRKCADVLAHKKKEYTGDRIDRLSAFKIAASLQGCTPKAALAGMMSKHIVSLYDMCYSSLLQFELEQWDEKITDCINYLILLKALIKIKLIDFGLEKDHYPLFCLTASAPPRESHFSQYFFKTSSDLTLSQNSQQQLCFVIGLPL